MKLGTSTKVHFVYLKWDAPKENGGVSCGVVGREVRKGTLEFFSEKENQETQQPHPGEGDAPEKNPHCVAMVLLEKEHTVGT
ncbi:hypothetical protein JHK85_001615 [Glycine max]|nr:hypothetical protein JHK85_001615 [Glycine max]